MVIKSFLPTVTVFVGVALGLLSPNPGQSFTLTLLPALAIAALAPLATYLALALLAPGTDLTMVSTAGMLTAIGMVNLSLASSTQGPDQDFLRGVAFRQGLFIGAGFLALVTG